VNKIQAHITVARRGGAIGAISIACHAAESFVSASPRTIRMECLAVVVPSFRKGMAVLDEEI
jgi:hypothetical protein